MYRYIPVTPTGTEHTPNSSEKQGGPRERAANSDVIADAVRTSDKEAKLLGIVAIVWAHLSRKERLRIRMAVREAPDATT